MLASAYSTDLLPSTPQGTGKNPNVRFQRRVEGSGEHRLGVYVMKTKIKKGEELLITYGWGFALA